VPGWISEAVLVVTLDPHQAVMKRIRPIVNKRNIADNKTAPAIDINTAERLHTEGR